ncbi:MAG: hypothetical protein AABM67_03650 [Acidobacteriota bacterium]
MIKFIFAILLTVSLAGLSTSAQQKYWTGFYIRERVSGSANETCRCELLQSEEKMDSYLPRVGWPIEKVKPSVDWNKELVIVISPGKSYSGFDLAFSDVKWTGSEFRLDWGWWDSYRQQYRWSSTSTVGGNRNPKILVVVVRRYVAESYTLRCSEIGR